MAKPIRVVLVLFASLAAVALAVALVAWWLVDADRVGKRLEAGLGDVLDLDVHIGQPPAFGLLRGARVTLTDLEVSREGQMVGRAENARVRIALFSLLAGNVRPLELHLERPEFSIERLRPGVFNFYQPGAERGTLDDRSLRRLRVSDARLNYFDRVSNLEWRFEDCNLDLRNLRHGGGSLATALATLAADGQLQCQNLSQDQFVVSEFMAEIHGADGVFELNPVNATAFEGALSVRLKADLSSSPPGFGLTGELSQFDIGAFMAILEPDQASTGRMNLELDLSARGSAWQEIRSSAMGTLGMTAGGLVLDGYDLDDELDGYAATQRFNLVDVGAVFLAGPIGLVASRGYAFSGLLAGRGGSTRIDQMVSEWNVENGVAQARDVAFRTPDNRLALAGALDFTDYSFTDLRVAVVDRDGCAIVEQRISGAFRQPEVKQPNFLVTVAGPLLDLVNRGVQAITDKDCEAFYTGTIGHP